MSEVSIINSNESWVTVSGSMTNDGCIHLDNYSSCSMHISSLDKTKKLKLVLQINCENKNISTDYYKNVSMQCTIKYTNGKQLFVGYYPQYVFEDTYSKNYNEVTIDENDIEYIDVLVTNSEAFEITVEKVDILVDEAIDKKDINNIVNSTLEQVDKKFEEAGYNTETKEWNTVSGGGSGISGGNGKILIIPKYSELGISSVSELPEGAVFIMDVDI